MAARGQQNTASDARVGRLTVDAEIVVVGQEGTCDATVSPGILTIDAAGGTRSVTLQTSCAWTAVSADPWVTVTSAPSGTGNATVQFSIAANAGARPRETVLAVGSRVVRIGQSGISRCVTLISTPPKINPSSSDLYVTAPGGVNNIDVFAPASCSWSVNIANDWLTSAPGGIGNGTVPLTASQNPLSSDRFAIVRVGDVDLDVHQGGFTPCSTIWPRSRAMASAGGTFTVTVDGPADCQWSFYRPSPSFSWVDVTPASGTGPASVTVSVAPFDSSNEARRHALTAIGGNTFEVIQSAPPFPWWFRQTVTTVDNFADGTVLASDDGGLLFGRGIRTVSGQPDLHDILLVDTIAGTSGLIGLTSAGYADPTPRALSSDGRFLMFSSGSQLALLDRADDTVTALLPPGGRNPVAMDAAAHYFVVSDSNGFGVWDCLGNQIVADLPARYSGNTENDALPGSVATAAPSCSTCGSWIPSSTRRSGSGRTPAMAVGDRRRVGPPAAVDGSPPRCAELLAGPS